MYCSKRTKCTRRDHPIGKNVRIFLPKYIISDKIIQKTENDTLDVIDLDEILTVNSVREKNFLSYRRKWARLWFGSCEKIKIKKTKRTKIIELLKICGLRQKINCSSIIYLLQILRVRNKISKLPGFYFSPIFQKPEIQHTSQKCEEKVTID